MPAMFRLEGEILLWSGERIRLDSDSQWLAESVPPFDARYDWTEPMYSDLGWRPAVNLTRSGRTVPDLHFQAFDQRVLTTPFAGLWIRGETALASDSVWFESAWDLPTMPDDAWLRLAVNRSFDLFLNNHRVPPHSSATPIWTRATGYSACPAGPICRPHPSCSTLMRWLDCSLATASNRPATAIRAGWPSSLARTLRGHAQQGPRNDPKRPARHL